MSTTALSPVTAGVLIGGRSSRMGSPKHLLILDGRSWLAHVIAAVSPLTDRIVLLGAGELPDDLPTGPAAPRRLPDLPEIGGPLSGLAALMRAEPDRAVLLLSCDAPRIRTADLSPLIEARSPGLSGIAWQIEDRLQPLPLLLEPSARSTVESCVREGRGSLVGMCERAGIGRLPRLADPDRIRGWNRADDIAR